MKARFMLVFLLALALLAMGTVACNRARSDAQISSDVQSRIMADPAVQNKQITVSSANGVVTLSGEVSSEEERAAVANDAAQVEGVRTVVNNLQMSAPEPNAEMQPPPKEPPAPAPVPARRRTTAKKPSAVRPSDTAPSYSSRASNAPMEDYSSPSPISSPPAPVRVTIPDGTMLSIRLVDALDSERNQVGDTFRASLDAPLYVNDNIVVPANADIQGRVVAVKSAAHFKGSSLLTLELTKLSFNGKSYQIRTDEFSRQGAARGKNTAAKVGGGAALGALIGGLAGGGKGAAIGAAVGAGAGTGVQAATRGEQIKLSSEQLLNFHLRGPVTVTAASSLERGSRQRLDSDQ